MTVEVAEQQVPQSGELTKRHALELPGVNSRLQQFAADGAAAMSIARSLAGTSFVPTSYKKARRKGQDGRWADVWFEPDQVAYNVTAAWLAGDELGLKPMQALQAINIIEGTPALTAQSMRALVQSHGHDVWVAEQSPTTAQQTDIFATVRGVRKGSDRIQEITWTWKRARQAGLVEKDNWTKDALAMCIARGTSAVCRLIAADVLMGLAYSAEELGDELEGLSAEQVAAPAPRGRLQRKPQQGQEGRSALPAGTEPQGPVEAPVTPSEPVEETPEVPVREETPEPTSRLQSDPELAEAHRRSLAEAAAIEPGDLCGQEKADGTALCSREAGHDGRHHFGRAKPVGLPPEQIDEDGQEFISDGPAVAEFVPTREEAAGADEGGDAELAFPDVSDEENEAAYLAEQEERAQQERSRLAAEAAETAEPRQPTGPSAVGGRPVAQVAELPEEPNPLREAASEEIGRQTANVPLDDEDDDPWKDFR